MAIVVRDTDTITIVSGLPRSGTSMMMRMLEAGGMPVLVDDIRQPDDDNPRGYYEFEAVKQSDRDTTWLSQARGRAVKMVYRLLYRLPVGLRYRVLLMQRDLREVIASQNAMLARHGHEAEIVDGAVIAPLLEQEMRRVKTWLRGREQLDALEVDYNAMSRDAWPVVEQVHRFLGGRLDLPAMVGVYERSLHRQRR
jgi:Sulfotransferase domain